MNSKHNANLNTLYIGTSGWSYDHWKGPFYPEDIATDHLLAYYCHHFSSVEINSSFYHLPQKQTLEQWCNIVPAYFRFSVKASRYITHMKKLKESEESISTFLDRISMLGDHLGPILFQLPPHWQFNAERLSTLLRALSSDFRYVFEFRDTSWINEQTYELLGRYNAAFCIYELDGYLSPKIITTDIIYIRLHGPAGAYQGCYDSRTLAGWAGAISSWLRQGHGIYCYFDNDEAGYAAQNAIQLQAMLQRQKTNK